VMRSSDVWMIWTCRAAMVGSVMPHKAALQSAMPQTAMPQGIIDLRWRACVCRRALLSHSAKGHQCLADWLLVQRAAPTQGRLSQRAAKRMMPGEPQADPADQLQEMAPAHPQWGPAATCCMPLCPMGATCLVHSSDCSTHLLADGSRHARAQALAQVSNAATVVNPPAQQYRYAASTLPCHCGAHTAAIT
jgi:hypothetical protein